MTVKTEPDGEYVTTRRALLGVAPFVAALPILISGARTLAQVAGPPTSIPYTTVPSNPWPLPTLRAHPRIFLTPTRLARLQSLWASPPAIMTGLKTTINADTQILSHMIKYLATGSLTELTSAYTTAVATSFPASGFTGPYNLMGNGSSFVLDWGYNDLSGSQRTALISQLDSFCNSYIALPSNGPLAGCGQEQGYCGFVYAQLAIQGEVGATDRLQTLSNVLQNVAGWIDETMGSGHWQGYPNEDVSFMMAFIAYHIATNQENLIASRFNHLANRMNYLAYRTANNGYTLLAAPSHHKAQAVTTQSGATLDQSIQSPGTEAEYALHYAVYADVLKSRLAQTAVNSCTTQNANFKWTNGKTSMTFGPTWLAFMFYNSVITPVAYSTLPQSRSFPLPGLVAFRGGWTQVNDVKGWFWCGIYNHRVHDTHYAGALEISRGDDQLICNQYTYAGQPSGWQINPYNATEVGNHSMCKSTVLFSPTGSATPDRSGSQGQTQDPASYAQFPLSTTFGIGTEGTGTSWINGTIDSFVYGGSSPGAKSQATGTYSGAYYPNSVVTTVNRVVAYVNGANNTTGTFFVQDNFVLVSGAVHRIRALWGMRQKPIGMTSETIVAGVSAAGVMTYPNQKVVVQWRNSQATIQMVSPTPTVLRLVGGGNGINGAPAGPGYESYFDGANLDYYNNAQSGKNNQQYKRIQGCWRLECETTPAAAKGQMLFAITVGDIGSTAPTYTEAQVLGIMRPPGRVIVVP
jgi:hypothetical protein